MNTWLLWTILCATGPSAGPAGAGHWQVDQRVSPAFKLQVCSAWANLPPVVVDTLWHKGVQIELVPLLADALPDLADQAPRGWPGGWTWKNVDAVHLPSSHRLVFAEWRLSLEGKIVRCNRIDGVFRHELGHAWDAAVSSDRLVSESPGFRLAYSKDLASMTPLQQRELAYFVQEFPAGREETVAEIFAICLGGGSAIGKQVELREAFSSVFDLIERDLATDSKSPITSTSINSATQSAETD